MKTDYVQLAFLISSRSHLTQTSQRGALGNDGDDKGRLLIYTTAPSRINQNKKETKKTSK